MRSKTDRTNRNNVGRRLTALLRGGEGHHSHPLSAIVILRDSTVLNRNLNSTGISFGMNRRYPACLSCSRTGETKELLGRVLLYDKVVGVGWQLVEGRCALLLLPPSSRFLASVVYCALFRRFCESSQILATTALHEHDFSWFGDWARKRTKSARRRKCD